MCGHDTQSALEVTSEGGHLVITSTTREATLRTWSVGFQLHACVSAVRHAPVFSHHPAHSECRRPPESKEIL